MDQHVLFLFFFYIYQDPYLKKLEANQQLNILRPIQANTSRAKAW